jgi:hypothetical protein
MSSVAVQIKLSCMTRGAFSERRAGQPQMHTVRCVILQRSCCRPHQWSNTLFASCSTNIYTPPLAVGSRHRDLRRRRQPRRCRRQTGKPHSWGTPSGPSSSCALWAIVAAGRRSAGSGGLDGADMVRTLGGQYLVYHPRWTTVWLNGKTCTCLPFKLHFLSTPSKIQPCSVLACEKNSMLCSFFSTTVAANVRSQDVSFFELLLFSN